MTFRTTASAKLVIQVELARPLTSLFVDRRFSSVWAVATFDGAPLTTFELDIDPLMRTISAERLRQEAVEGSAWTLWRKAIERSFDQPHTCLPPISVVVCTRDRATQLERCLESLRRLDYPHYEVIVVDNCSRDPEVGGVIERSGFRSIREHRPGLNWARNRGIAESCHDIIAYIDDDAVASPGWLRAIAKAFQDPAVMAVTGLVLPAQLETDAQLLFERYGGMSKGMTGKSFSRATLPGVQVFGTHECGVGANMAFRRQVLECLGRFDTKLDAGTPAGGAGDLDMFHRVLAAGLTLRYEPDALLWHEHRRSHAALRRQIYDNGRAYGVYLLKTWLEGRTAGSARFAARWFFRWVVRGILRGVARRDQIPLDLRWAEFRGAVSAPLAYLAAE